MKTLAFRTIAVVVTAVLVLMLCVSRLKPQAAFAKVSSFCSWSELKRAGELKSGMELVKDERLGAVLKLEAPPSPQPGFKLYELSNPPITSSQYELMGKIRYEQVAEEGYLELMNYFPGGQAFFTRTMAPSGPMAVLHGSAGWYDLSLPFQTDGQAKPEKLVLNLILPKGGTVYLSSLSLVQSLPPEAESGLGQKPGQWLSDRDAIHGGAYGGALLGILGGIVGTLAGLGKARRLVMGLSGLALAGGAALIAVGLYALAAGQSWILVYPMLLLGVISLGVFGTNLPVIKRRYQELELRKMQAKDLA